jgi:stage V sporulation protein B
MMPMVITVVGGLSVHILILWLLMSGAPEVDGLIIRVVVSNLISMAFVFVTGFMFIARMVKYQGEWLKKSLRTLVITLLCSAISGLMAMLLCQGIQNLVGPALTIMICLIVAVLAYLVLMTLLRGLTANELERIPGGYLLLRLGRLFNFF